MKKTIISAASLTALSAVAAANISASEVTVEPGDTLWSISNGNLEAVNEIKTLNNLTTDLIFTGDVLTVSAEAPAAAPVEEVEVNSTTYTIEAGDTLFAIADQFDVTIDELKAWNNLSSDLIIAGKTLVVAEEAAPEAAVVQETAAVEAAPVVEAAEPVQEVQAAEVAPVQEYAAPAVQEVQAAEVAPVQEYAAPAVEEYAAPAVQQVAQPQAATPAAQAAPAPATPVSSASNGSNYYTWGTCAWYVFEQRSQRGLAVDNGWGDATNWASAAQSAGYSVSNSPSVGAIMQANAYTNGSYGQGHVAIVESVNADGSILVSEMQFGGGLGDTNTRTISASQAANHNFIN